MIFGALGSPYQFYAVFTEQLVINSSNHYLTVNKKEGWIQELLSESGEPMTKEPFIGTSHLIFSHSYLRRAIIAIVLFSCLSLFKANPLWAQHDVARLSGIIKDAKTGERLPAANVFLSGTKRGTSSDKDGKFYLQTIPSGTYNLVVSFVGYQPWTRTIHLSAGDHQQLNIRLQPRQYMLGDVSVTGKRPKEWKRNLRQFNEIFIGSGPNAELTWIQNPEILHFKTEDNQLIAEARGTLDIENRALGYKLHVVLKNFRWSQINDTGIYTFYPRFERLDPQTPEIARKWKLRRRHTFEGSLHHFLLALRHGQTNRKGYVFKRSLIKRLSKGEEHMALLPYGRLSPEYRESLVGFELKGDVKVNYKHYPPSYLLKRRGEIFFVDSYGNLMDPRAVTLAGRWARERVSDLVPYEFRR